MTFLQGQQHVDCRATALNAVAHYKPSIHRGRAVSAAFFTPQAADENVIDTHSRSKRLYYYVINHDHHISLLFINTPLSLGL